jgi:hypothetical protein
MSVGLSPKHCWAITEMRRKPIGLNSEVKQEERVVLIGLVADSIPTVPSDRRQIVTDRLDSPADSSAVGRPDSLAAW